MKSEDLKKFERMLKGLANHRRLGILKFLQKAKETNVSGIAESINLSFASTSKHLGILANLDILEKTQRSLEMYYRIAPAQHTIVDKVISIISNSRE